MCRNIKESKPLKTGEKLITISVISGFRRDVDEIGALLGYYAALSATSVDDSGQPIGLIFKGKKVNR